MSNHIANISEKVTLEVTLISVIELYTNEYGVTVFINTLRTRGGDIIAYKGKDLSEDYICSCGFVLGLSLTSYDAVEIFGVKLSLTDRYYALFKKDNFVALTATVKDHSEYNGQLQTVVQRPKLNPLANTNPSTLTAKAIKAMRKAEKAELLEIEALVVEEIGYMPKFKKNGNMYSYRNILITKVAPKLYKLTYQIDESIRFGGYFLNLDLAKAAGMIVLLYYY